MRDFDVINPYTELSEVRLHCDLTEMLGQIF